MSRQMTGAGRVVEVGLELPADLASVSTARQFVRSQLAGDGQDDDVSDIVVLLTSEVVTNAILHAGAPCRIDLRMAEGSVRVEVTDGSSTPLRPRPVPPHAESGRGLFLLDRLAGHWGACTRDSGKSVWFDVERPSGSD